MVYLQYNRIWCCNVGDSRIYRLRNGIIKQLSFDHVENITTEFCKKPALIQHIGMNIEKTSLFPYMADDRMQEGDVYLICSDGLTDMVTRDEICNILQNKFSPPKYNKLLLKKALENGGKDNISIITFKVK